MGYPYGPPYAPVASPKPGGGTAITAGVLTLLQGIGVTVLAIAAAVSTRQDRQDGSDVSGDIIGLVVVGGIAALLLAGAILLLARRTAGRVIVIGMSALVMLVIPGLGILLAVTSDVEQGDVLTFAVLFGILLVVELPILVCAVASSTGRWIAARTAPDPMYPYH
ncbi:hypothetical protein AB0L57_06420 [Nocardia sp. NPDC052254]|uniref:hypothetical protein n=1 Tax=Nocardia sp. NPDC052254 TaxID=3155681 RepID=UPI003431BD13